MPATPSSFHSRSRSVSFGQAKELVSYLGYQKTRLWKGKRTLLHCGIKNAAMHLLKKRRHNYVDRHTLQTTSFKVRHSGETDTRRRVPPTIYAVAAYVSSSC